MKRSARGLAVAVPLVLAIALFAALSGGASARSRGAHAASGKCSYRFAVITHGDNGSFWSVVYKGARAAAADTGCKLSEVYGSQQQGQAEPDDNAENAQIQDAINQKVNGIVVSDHDPTLMNKTIASAVKHGIPVVLTNAGCDPTDIAQSHALTCVGQPEVNAGIASGKRFKQLGKTNVLCVIHQSGQNLLDRCNGIAQGLGVGSKCKTSAAPRKGPACTELTLSTPNAASNPQQAVGQVTAYLQAHPGVNAVMALNNAIGAAIVASHPKATVASFDVDTQDLQEVKQGKMAFVVDQQQFQQGYLPIVFLYMYDKYHHNTVGGGGVVQTGPFLVDKSNVSKVVASAKAGDD